MPSTVIVFDLGKVLVDFDYSIAARRIGARARAGTNIPRIFAENASVLTRYETGLIDTAGFFGAMCDATGFCGSADEFAEFFADIFTPIPAMVELHAELRRKGFPTYIFSNTNDLAVAHIRNRFSFFRDFDGYILSYEHGAMKPDAKLYEVVERETKHRGSEIVYLDDRAENIATALDRGWHAILHESPEKTRAALKALAVI